jgi:hypothetical protein
MPQQYNTVHIFGYGETQIIGEGYNKKTATSGLTKVQAVVDDVWSKKPQDSDASQDYRAINIFDGMFSDYQPNTGTGYRTPFAELDANAIQELVDEVYAAVPDVQPQP